MSRKPSRQVSLGTINLDASKQGALSSEPAFDRAGADFDAIFFETPPSLEDLNKDSTVSTGKLGTNSRSRFLGAAGISGTGRLPSVKKVGWGTGQNRLPDIPSESLEPEEMENEGQTNNDMVARSSTLSKRRSVAKKAAALAAADTVVATKTPSPNEAKQPFRERGITDPGITSALPSVNSSSEIRPSQLLTAQNLAEPQRRPVSVAVETNHRPLSTHDASQQRARSISGETPARNSTSIQDENKLFKTPSGRIKLDSDSAQLTPPTSLRHSRRKSISAGNLSHKQQGSNLSMLSIPENQAFASGLPKSQTSPLIGFKEPSQPSPDEAISGASNSKSSLPNLETNTAPSDVKRKHMSGFSNVSWADGKQGSVNGRIRPTLFGTSLAYYFPWRPSLAPSAERDTEYISEAAAIAMADSSNEVLKSLVNPWTLTFYDQQTEDSYRAYFAQRCMPMWRVGILVQIIISTLLVMYQIVVFNQDSNDYKSLKADRKSMYPDLTDWTSIPCPFGIVCQPCQTGKLCGEYEVMSDLLVFLFASILPGFIFFVLSFLITPLGRSSKFVHTIGSFLSFFHMLGTSAFHHYMIIPSITPLRSGILFVTIIFGINVFIRVRFTHSLFFAPMGFVVFYVLELKTMHNTDAAPDYTGLFFSSALVAASLIVQVIGSYSHERIFRSHYVHARNYLSQNAKLMGRLEDLSKSYKNRIADFDSPLEKAVEMINMIRHDYGLPKKVFDQISEVLELLNSSDLMTPDIQRQVEGGKVALDAEQEKWVITNLYRGRSRRRRSTFATSDTGDTQGDDKTIPSKLLRQDSRAESEKSHPNSQRRESIMMTTEHKRRLSTLVVTSLNYRTFDRGPVPQVEIDSTSGSLAAISHHELGETREIHRSMTTPGKAGIYRQGSASAFSGSFTELRRSASRVGNVLAKLESVNELGEGALLTESPAMSMEFLSQHQQQQQQQQQAGQLPSQAIADLLESADQWNWPLFEMDVISNNRALMTLAHFLFLRADLYAAMKINAQVFLKFVEAIEDGYHPNVPYHNALHATDVLHGVSFLIANCEEAVVATDLELMAIYVAAIIHDFDHPGKNNNFLVNTSDNRALLYNDRSVLENHHLAAAFKVLMCEENNFISHLSRDDYKQLRELIIELVLATDLQTQHFVVLSMFKNKVALTKSFNPNGSEEDRTLLWKMILKCADVSNPTKEMSIYNKWTERVLQEFFLQGDAERAAGLPISPYYDRDTINVPNSQIGFIEFICIPLFEAFDTFSKVPVALEGLHANRDYWTKKRDEANGVAAAPTSVTATKPGLASAPSTANLATVNPPPPSSTTTGELQRSGTVLPLSQRFGFARSGSMMHTNNQSHNIIATANVSDMANISSNAAANDVVIKIDEGQETSE